MLRVTLRREPTGVQVEFKTLDTETSVSTTKSLAEATVLAGSIVNALNQALDATGGTEVATTVDNAKLAETLFCTDDSGCPLHLFHRVGDIYYLGDIPMHAE